MRLWQFYGPWGPRRLVALEYAVREKYLPKDFDWAAASLQFRYPQLPYYAPASERGLDDMYLQQFKPLPKTLPEYRPVSASNPPPAPRAPVSRPKPPPPMYVPPPAPTAPSVPSAAEPESPSPPVDSPSDATNTDWRGWGWPRGWPQSWG